MTSTNCSKSPLVDHVGITVSDYDKAKDFYTAIFSAVGAKLHMEIGPPHTQEGESFLTPPILLLPWATYIVRIAF